jgi:hypothetical protein
MLAHSHSELKRFRYIVFFDTFRQYVDCSDDVLHFLGYTRPDFLKKTVDDVSYCFKELPLLFKDFLRHGQQEGTYILKHVNGSPLPIQYRAYTFPDGCKAAGWTPIQDWRAPYFAAISEADHGKLGHRIDVALAAIYRKLYENRTEVPVEDSERAAVAEALYSLSPLRQKVASEISPELLEFEKTRCALLRLADTTQDRDAIRVLFEEHRELIESLIQRHLASISTDKMLPALLDRIALRARYYDPDTNPEVWLQDCIHLECKRLRMETDREEKGNGAQPPTLALE